MLKSIKCVVVGDKDVGKTSMLTTYVTNSFPGQYVPSDVDGFTGNMKVGTQDISLMLGNIAHQVDYNRLRPLAYPSTDIFLVCFSLVSPSSFRNVEKKWAPELKHYCPDTPILLVGTNLDLREGKEISASVLGKDQRPISFDQGRQLAEKIKAVNYCECSAVSQEGLKDVFDEAINIALLNEGVKPAKKIKDKVKTFFNRK